MPGPATLAELTEFKTLAISRLVAQHDEIERLRRQIAATGPVRPLPTSRRAQFGSCSLLPATRPRSSLHVP